MTEQPTQQMLNPKAQAKADKAYSKAMRPWFKKKRFIIPIALVALIAIIVATSGGDSTDKSGESVKAPTASKAGANSGKSAPKATSAFGTDKMPLQNGDWRLDSIKLSDDGLGSFGGRARITYTGDDKDGGNNIFTITVFKGKDDVASLQGSANTVKPGTTVTVQFISTEDFVKGPYKYDFQNDL